mmetsp:Transcript_40067/g.101791  ORF Transcript_40067/g.101791 Transcript_40067/m.101791 type:complete len:277 (+) Transcript_40067:881-1711(+)
MHEIHSDGVVLAEGGLPDERAAVGAVHGSHGLDQAERVCSDCGHFLRLQHIAIVVCWQHCLGVALDDVLEDQGCRRRPLVRPKVCERSLLDDVFREQALEDLLPNELAIDRVLRLELAHLRGQVGQQIRLILRAEAQVVQVLGPRQAVHGLLRRGSDCAIRIDLLSGLCLALEALCLALLYHGHLAQVPSRARLQQRFLGGQAESVHVPPGLQVVERIDDHIELRDELDAELRVLDVAVVGRDVRARSELLHGLGRNLCLRPVHVLPAEQELAIQV